VDLLKDLTKKLIDTYFVKIAKQELKVWGNTYNSKSELQKQVFDFGEKGVQ